MKNNMRMLSLLLGILFWMPLAAQKKTTGKTYYRAKINVRKKPENKCKEMQISSVLNILKNKVGRTLEINLDKDYGYVKINGITQNLRFPEYRVKKPGYNWKYYLNDVKSTVTRIRYKSGYFILNITFEDKGHEIKGKCPGCKVGKDKRAPDINWQNPSVFVSLKPVAENGKLIFKVQNVWVNGKFTLNGPVKFFLSPATVFFKSAIVKKIKTATAQIFLSPSFQQMISDAFKPYIQAMDIGPVKRVDFSAERMYLCNY